MTPDDDELIASLRSFVPHVLDVTHTPGVSVALARRGELIWEQGFGCADLASGRPMTAASVTHAGSIAKLYVATAVLQLVDRGLLRLHGPVNRHLGGLRLDNPLGEREITLYDLLTFRSGLAVEPMDGGFSDATLTRRPPPSLAEHVAASLAGDARPEYHSGTSRWAAKVGAEYRYSNFGFALLGRVVELADPAGRSFTEYVAHEIAGPLGLRSTVIPRIEQAGGGVSPQILDRRATGYARFGDLCIPSPAMHCAGFPASLLLTTPGEHLRFLLEVSRAAAGHGDGLLSAASARMMITPQLPLPVGDPGWFAGIAFEIANLRRPDQHFGRAGAYPWGWWSDARVYPRLGVALMVTTNSWQLTRWHNPSEEIASGLVADHVVGLLTAERRHDRRPITWRQRRSYAMGLVLAERCNALVGMPDPLTDAQAAAMAEGARSGDGSAADWDAAAFRAGVRDARDAMGADPAAIRAFLASERCALSPPQQALIWLSLGSRGGRSPIPMRFWADALEQAPVIGGRMP
jgi:CubicO group peptidase (beta-lactamase class C family)